jgi:hypothetical protein
MGELIFSFAYGSALIIMGFITRFFLKRMEVEARQREGVEKIEGLKNNDNYKKAV